MPFKIFVADDEIYDKHKEISRLPEMLQAAGYKVITTQDGMKAYDLVLESKPDLVVLDISFKNQSVDGFEICRSIRDDDPDIPIIIITGVRTKTDDTLCGFEAGANDYVIRPRDNREIVARIRVNLPQEVFIVEDYLYVDLVGFQVFIKRDGSWQEVRVQPLEFELLKTLILHAGLVMLTTTLKSKLWENENPSDNALAVYIRRLRKHIEPDPANPVYIENVKGFGYRFNGEPVHTNRRFFGKSSDWKKEGRCPTCGSIIT